MQHLFVKYSFNIYTLLLPLPFPASTQSLAVLLKALQGEVPWAAYCRLLAGSSKDHATAISTADLVRSLVTGVSSRPLSAAHC